MQMNPIGVASAAALFTAVWLGHVGVRYFEARIARLQPAIYTCLALGLFLGLFSASTDNNLLSAVCGIVAVTTFWDAFEFTRQQKRVQNGHAPANPANPRHAAYLSQPGSQATTHDLLKRQPSGSSAKTEDEVW